MAEVLLTGGTGLVGSSVASALVRNGRSVRALVRSLERGREGLPSACELFHGDVTDIDSVRAAMRGCSAVYHVAGLPEQWLPDPSVFERVNAGGTRNMIQVALECMTRACSIRTRKERLTSGRSRKQTGLSPLPSNGACLLCSCTRPGYTARPRPGLR
jgi:nucleoside-diphosphate-sugar epimerase